MNNLKPCPCGEVPESLSFCASEEGPEYGVVAPSCCDEWSINYRVEFFSYDSEQGKAAGTSAWNDAPRGGE